MYLTYKNYQNMGGTLDETAFNNYEFEAETIVNWYTFDRLKDEDEENYPDALSKLMNRLIELLKLRDDSLQLGSKTKTSEGEGGKTVTITESPYISSQSNDGVSISYNTVSASEAYRLLSSREPGNIYETTCQTYLHGLRNSLGKKLLYRGLYPDE